MANGKPKLIKCPYCHGTGKDPAGKACPQCGGNGKIELPANTPDWDKDFPS